MLAQDGFLETRAYGEGRVRPSTSYGEVERAAIAMADENICLGFTDVGRTGFFMLCNSRSDPRSQSRSADWSKDSWISPNSRTGVKMLRERGNR
jgi:hypothetical protein